MQREDAAVAAARIRAVTARKAAAEAFINRCIANKESKRERVVAANQQRSAMFARRHAERAHMQERLAGTFSASSSSIFQTGN